MYYFAYEKNHLPDNGSVSDQQNSAMQVLQIVQGAFSQAYAEKQAEENAPKGDPR